MRRCFILVLVVACLVGSCSPSARSEKSYDQIRKMVSGKSATEVEHLLGPPDAREKLLLGDERWIWWNYTYLGGKQYPPETRGRIVHLEITFETPSAQTERSAHFGWRVSQPYGVGFTLVDAR